MAMPVSWDFCPLEASVSGRALVALSCLDFSYGINHQYGNPISFLPIQPAADLCPDALGPY
eukprot:8819162-Ditylum_brightwellii.AAC.1